jgi:hypothetical protein
MSRPVHGGVLRSIAAAAIVIGFAGAAFAQAYPRPVPPPPPAFSVRLFGEGGLDRLNATRSFTAIFSTDQVPMFGGGVEAVVASNWFVRFGIWRFNEQGERAVRLENQTFRLGIPLKVTVIPIEVSGGYRFPLGRRRVLIPYAGAGISSHSYKETSEFAEGDENVDERFTGYQLLGGVEYRLHRSIGIAGEVQYTTVPDAIGAGGLSAEFNETDLGGLIVRARILFGR